MTAKELFADWVEPDVSEYYLACLIGIMDLDTDRNDSFLKAKGVLNSRNRLSTALYHMLENMVAAGMLETNEYTQFRWLDSFKGSWEGGTDGLH